MAYETQKLLAGYLQGGGTKQGAKVRAEPATACPATTAMFVREDDGAWFIPDRYGETPSDFLRKRYAYSVLSGRLLLPGKTKGQRVT
jgi:hypothetical protein